MCTTWFTFSAADNHQLDVNKLIFGDREILEFANEYEKAKWRRKLVRNNQHIVDSYFYDRIKNVIDFFLEKKDQNIVGFGLELNIKKEELHMLMDVYV